MSRGVFDENTDANVDHLSKNGHSDKVQAISMTVPLQLAYMTAWTKCSIQRLIKGQLATFKSS